MATAVRVGRSLTAATVSRKVSVAVAVPSLTVTVRMAEPFWLAAGVTVTVRLAPEPARTMAELGTRVVLEELAVSVDRKSVV